MRIAIVEPHFDDCWLNMGGFMLKNPSHEYLVITATKDDDWGNNHNNTAKLAQYIPRLTSVSLAYQTLDVNTAKVIKQMQDAGLTSMESLFAQLNGIDERQAYDEITSQVRGYDLLFLPMGISHPMHLVVGEWEFDQPSMRYFEYPYAWYPEERDHVVAKLRDSDLVEYDIGDVIGEKIRIFKETYPHETFVLNLPECSIRLESIKKERYFTNDKEALQAWRI